jgi:hypothetical protein
VWRCCWECVASASQLCRQTRQCSACWSFAAKRNVRMRQPKVVLEKRGDRVRWTELKMGTRPGAVLFKFWREMWGKDPEAAVGGCKQRATTKRESSQGFPNPGIQASSRDRIFGRGRRAILAWRGLGESGAAG